MSNLLHTWTIQTPVVTVRTTSWTFSNSPFCPQCIYVFCMDLRTAIISLYSINWLVCITETECVYWAVRTGSLHIIQVMCFVWIWEQTAIISLYNINWLVCITETECVYCAVQTGSLYIIRVVWISEKTGIISLYSIIWLVFTRGRVCLLPSKSWIIIIVAIMMIIWLEGF